MCKCWASLVVQLVRICLQCRRPWFNSWVRKIPGEGIGYRFLYSWASLVFQMVKNHLQCGRPGFDPWVGKIPWRKAWQPTPVFLPGESSWTEEPGRLQSTGSQRIKNQTQLRKEAQQAKCVYVNSKLLIYPSPSPL